MADVTPTPDTKKVPVKTPSIPRADADLRDTALLVSSNWHDNPNLTLLWITQANFDATANHFKDTLASRKSTGSARPEFTGKLSDADERINTGAKRIKEYLAGKYGEKIAKTYYAAFGIFKIRNSYEIPADHENRKDSLELLIPALTVHGFQNMDYGVTFWTQVQSDFLADLAKTIDIDSTVSSKVGDKKELKKQICKVLNALINLLKANYPDTYVNVKRAWGFQKEKY